MVPFLLVHLVLKVGVEMLRLVGTEMCRPSQCHSEVHLRYVILQCSYIEESTTTIFVIIEAPRVVTLEILI